MLTADQHPKGQGCSVRRSQQESRSVAGAPAAETAAEPLGCARIIVSEAGFQQQKKLHHVWCMSNRS
jgi:hypothetical protein